MPGTLASLLIKLGLDATGVEQGVAQANRSVGGVSTEAGMAMKVAGSLIGGDLAFAAKGALEMEDRAARFQAETGASAEEARHFADSVNASAGSSLVSMPCPVARS
jgi:phage-related tail protein